MTVLGLAVAVNVVISAIPPRLRVALVACTNVPVPLSAVLTVSVLLLVRVVPVTVMLGIEMAPVMACALVSKV